MNQSSARSVLTRCLESFGHLLYALTIPTKLIFYEDLLSHRFKSRAIRASVERFYRKGFIKKIKQDRNVFISFTKEPDFFILTEMEKEKLRKSKEPWDGEWRLLIYDIPERERAKRNMLRRFIAELGFGKLQGSNWVSPYDYVPKLHEFCAKEKILPYICLYEGRFFSGKNIDDLVEQVWGLARISAEYKSVIDTCAQAEEELKRNTAAPQKCFDIYFEVYGAYAAVVKNDPCLPKEFLKHWPRDEAQRAFDNLVRRVSGNITRAI